MDAQAQRLLFTLMFENLPLQAHQRISTTMIGSYSAQFCLPDTTDRQPCVSVMCVPEHRHLALRISSASHIAYGATVAALANRLVLLLSVGNDADPTSLQSLRDLQTKYTDFVGKILQDADPPDLSPKVDFALVEQVRLDILSNNAK
ncbi:hypothetical protein H4S02_009267 [Coemansia sp. RSA 2611]|nr:hypothetical protein IWW52_006525 [Coemansia sp. RSA 2704]KAJ2314400.1 hypothetical protein IWW51_005987 [Coemansia sp. RSA 2702]KAJ2372266.1 hypothetical protein H4S02_009267 [Coemansia sp. RSA 2611]